MKKLSIEQKKDLENALKGMNGVVTEWVKDTFIVVYDDYIDEDETTIGDEITQIVSELSKDGINCDDVAKYNSYPDGKSSMVFK